ncbi:MULTISPECIES: hypothetical protein [Pseudanabaena]|uniref:Uncharacterized protein n=2 Tax=Pseudanabaena TaxID=1152 RepID=L8N3G6_9CYAN|nr:MULTISPECIES: hypothetical protein [Pseudanabaena]ELS32793.1 hypothetical protein Pse7429DRAFT_1998 [Pseudanabaena biceps PCC 7429]MDG3494979.1 hypothetical protein [Pseudanabaena catenata USMAC16]
MIDKLFGAIRRFIARSERDIIEEKLGRFDERLDDLESTDQQIYTRLDAIHQVNLANNESLEQKMNASRANQEALKETINTKFEYMSEALKDIKSLIRNTCER